MIGFAAVTVIGGLVLGCAPAQVDDLVGDDPAAPPLSRGDVAAILGAVAAQRFGVDNSFGGQAFSASLDDSWLLPHSPRPMPEAQLWPS